MEEVDYCSDPSKVRIFPGVVEGLRRLKLSGWQRIIVTNQSGLGRGYFSLQDYQAVQDELLRQLEQEIDAVYFCPDSPESATDRRKPGIGMLLEAAKDHALDLGSCWMIGDKEADMLCARTAGVSGILVRTGYGGDQPNPCPPHLIADHVTAAINEIAPPKS